MVKCGSNLSTFTLTILKKPTYLCQTRLKYDENINKHGCTNENGNIIPTDMNKNMYRVISTDEVVWELEEVDYSYEPIYI